MENGIIPKRATGSGAGALNNVQMCKCENVQIRKCENEYSPKLKAEGRRPKAEGRKPMQAASCKQNTAESGKP
jgi:hypothetical protein